MTSIERVRIEPIGPDSDGPLFDSALELRNVLLAEHDPDIDPDTAELFRGALRGTDTFAIEGIVAHLDGRALGIAIALIHNLETNADKFEIEIEVHPDHRRRGVGTLLLDAVLDLAERNGRTSIVAYNVKGDGVKGDGVKGDGVKGDGVKGTDVKGDDQEADAARAFWRAMGAEPKLVERESRMWLADTDEALMRDWVATRHDRAGDYRLEHFTGRTPERLIPAVAHLYDTMNDAPIDELDWDDDRWTADDVRQVDDFMIGRGRLGLTTIAFGPGDEPAGLTEVTTQNEKPRFAKQGNTVVDPAHRNRGIGRWLKAAMWLRLRDEAPFVAAVDTENAESNDSMLAINVAMGFRPLAEWVAYQADTTTLRARES